MRLYTHSPRAPCSNQVHAGRPAIATQLAGIIMSLPWHRLQRLRVVRTCMGARSRASSRSLREDQFMHETSIAALHSVYRAKEDAAAAR